MDQADWANIPFQASPRTEGNLTGARLSPGHQLDWMDLTDEVQRAETRLSAENLYAEWKNHAASCWLVLVPGVRHLREEDQIVVGAVADLPVYRESYLGAYGQPRSR